MKHFLVHCFGVLKFFEISSKSRLLVLEEASLRKHNMKLNAMEHKLKIREPRQISRKPRS
jgi:hypothetical protein